MTDDRDLKPQVEAQMGQTDLSVSELSALLKIPAMVLARFLRGEQRLPAQYRPAVREWLGLAAEEDAPGAPPVGDEAPQTDDPGAFSQTLGASPQAMAFVRQVCGGDDVTLDTFLTAFMERAVIGREETMAQVQALCPNATGDRLTLEDIAQRFADLREGHERALHRLTQRVVQPAVAAHTAAECAQTILSMTTPQVLEQMEMVMHATGRSAEDIMAGTLIMWRNDLLGADLTEVRAPTAVTRLGQQPWSPGAQTPTTRFEAVCETCGQTFATTPNQHNPRFGCAACGKVNDLKVYNALEEKRAAETESYRANIRPPTLEYVFKTFSLYPCTCGMPQAQAS